MPFLQRSKSIDIVTIAKNEEPRNELPGVDITHHLARHKLKVNLKPIVAPDSDVTNVVLSQAADSETDLIVMYGPQIIFDGRVVPTQDTLTASAHRTQVTALDYREVLRRRAILPSIRSSSQ